MLDGADCMRKAAPLPFAFPLSSLWPLRLPLFLALPVYSLFGSASLLERLSPEQCSLVGLTLWPACLLISEVRFCKLMAVGIAVLQPYCYGARHSQGTRLHLCLCAVLRKCNLDFFARIRK